MLAVLVGISLSVALPTLIVSHIFGQRPAAKASAPAAAQTRDGLLGSLQRSADTLLPAPPALAPDSITITVRPEHVAARLEKIRRQAAQFGGTATDGVPDAVGSHLFVDLPAASTAAFRTAVAPLAASSVPSPAAPATGTPAPTGIDHIEVIIRPIGDDE
jgi:hypothetical protein